MTARAAASVSGAAGAAGPTRAEQVLAKRDAVVVDLQADVEVPSVRFLVAGRGLCADVLGGVAEGSDLVALGDWLVGACRGAVDEGSRGERG